METVPTRFIDEPIEVIFLEEQTYEKRPECPQGFIWREATYMIVEIVSERQDFTRRGRFANNMSTGHLRSAMRLGSWGVGRYEFCVRVENGRIFDIYFDRAPQGAGDRKGHWFLKGERIEKTSSQQ
jgi:hypothetical protein